MGLVNSLDLRNGSCGAAVTRLQEDLTIIGVYSGAIDGIFAIKTETAVKTFQKRLNLTVDGIVDSRTMDAIQALFKGRVIARESRIEAADLYVKAALVKLLDPHSRI